MKPVDAIEFILRTTERELTQENLFARIKDLVREQSFTRNEMLEVLRSSSERFEFLHDGSVRIQPDRLEDRIGYFREYLHEFRRALSLMSFSNYQWLEATIIYALATHSFGTETLIVRKGEGVWNVLEPLARVYSELQRQIMLTIEAGGVMVTVPAEFALRMLTAVRLTPEEYVQQMRWVVMGERRTGPFVAPWPVAELMAALLGPDVQDVFDPAADASVLPVLLARTRPGEVRTTAVFSNAFAEFFNALQVQILGGEMKVVKWEDLGRRQEEGRQYSHCISAPPFGGRARQEGTLRGIEPYEVAIQQIIKRLAPEGKAVVLVPEAMLFSSARGVLRQDLVDQGLLRTVVSIPPGTFAPFTAIKTSILVLDKSLPNGTSVRFVEAGGFINTDPHANLGIHVDALAEAAMASTDTSVVRRVAVEDIKANDYDLRTARYVFPPEDQIEGGKRLGDMVSPLRLGHGTKGAREPLVRIRDLKVDELEFTLRSDSLDSIPLPPHVPMLDRSALLLAMRGDKLKPTWFEFTGTPVAISPDIFILKVDEEMVDIAFLIHELLSKKVRAQVGRLAIGEVVPRLLRKDILEVVIELPSKPEQQALVKGVREAYVEALRLSAVEQAERHGVELQQFGNTVSFKHRLGSPLLAVGSGIDTMRMSLDRIHPAWRNHVVSAPAQITLGTIMDNVSYELQRISAMLNADSLELEVAKYPLEPLDLVAFAKKVVHRVRGELNGGHSVSFYWSADIKDQLKGKAPILGNKALLEMAMDALVDNAKRHGFAQDLGPHLLDVRVSLRVEDDRTWIVLTVANTGQPFLDGFGLDRYVRKNVHAGPTGHTGIGGYHVQQIVQYHKGHLAINTAPKLMGLFATEMELYFPIAH